MRRLVWRNLLRNKRRAAFTVASLTLGVMLLCVLGALLQTFDPAQTEASENRVVVRHAVSLQFDLPEAYWRRLEGLDHVEVVSPLSWFGGIYKDTRRENFFSQFGSDPETLLAAFDDLEIEPEAAAAWLAERRSFIAGRALAEKHGWEIGDEIFLQGEIYPIDLNLVLRGIFTDSQDEAQENQIFFHRDYMEEALGNPGQVGTFWLLVDDLENVPEVIEATEAMFENSEARVKAETEQAFVLAFVQMMGNVELLFGAIGFAVIVSVFFITANTMAMAVRERSTEVSVQDAWLRAREGARRVDGRGDGYRHRGRPSRCDAGRHPAQPRGRGTFVRAVALPDADPTVRCGVARIGGGVGDRYALGPRAGLCHGAALGRRWAAQGGVRRG
jgi:putative ABC transport system permease protein